VSDITFNDMTSGAGAAWVADGAQGRLSGVQFNNVALGNRYITGGTTGFGLNAPTWSGGANDFIQDLNTTQLGTTGSKYTREGWIHDAANAAWFERRSLTGN
jgi:hypothetical protein